MFKTLIKFLALTFLFIEISLAEVVKKIEISGNKRISYETILVLGDLSINKELETKDLNNSLRKLYDTNFFSDVKISLNNGILKINLQENPIIEDIEITGIKNKKFSEKIYETMVLKNRMSFTEDQLQTDVMLAKSKIDASS